MPILYQSNVITIAQIQFFNRDRAKHDPLRSERFKCKNPFACFYFEKDKVCIKIEGNASKKKESFVHGWKFNKRFTVGEIFKKKINPN